MLFRSLSTHCYPLLHLKYDKQIRTRSQKSKTWGTVVINSGKKRLIGKSIIVLICLYNLKCFKTLTELPSRGSLFMSLTPYQHTKTFKLVQHLGRQNKRWSHPFGSGYPQLQCQMSRKAHPQGTLLRNQRSAQAFLGRCSKMRRSTAPALDTVLDRTHASRCGNATCAYHYHVDP